MKRFRFNQKQLNAIGALEIAGQRMSNVFFNRKQHTTFSEADRKMFGALQAEWDAAHRAFKDTLRFQLGLPAKRKDGTP